jgi:hypothetical protein
MTRNLLFNLLIVFILSTAFSGVNDTVIKESAKVDNVTNSTLLVQPVSKSINTDSLVVIAQQDILNYNKSVEMKDKSQLEMLQQNKKLLAYEKKENELIKAIIAKQKAKASKSDLNKIKTVDSICTKYHRPLFGKKVCVEYTTIYTITVDGKTIKLKEIK